jgi:hypothetical protein
LLESGLELGILERRGVGGLQHPNRVLGRSRRQKMHVHAVQTVIQLETGLLRRRGVRGNVEKVLVPRNLPLSHEPLTVVGRLFPPVQEWTRKIRLVPLREHLDVRVATAIGDLRLLAVECRPKL